MPHFVDDLQQQAQAAITRMQEAAISARHIHARAELMRHMLTTARKMKDLPRAQAVEQVVSEWMSAWNLDRAQWPQIAREMEAFTVAFHDYANEASDAADTRLRESCGALDDALSREGTSISDQMAFRSQCAHRWWELVVPTPAELPVRPEMPVLDGAMPFWGSGCAGYCI